MNRIQRAFVLSGLLGLALCLGCSGRYTKLPESGATLEGTITYNKEPVHVAMVIVQGDTSSATGFVGEDGRYKVENVPLGEVHIGVNTEAGKGQMRGQMMAKSMGKAAGPMPKMIDVPSKYFNPPDSGITTTIKEGQNSYDIVLTK